LGRPFDFTGPVAQAVFAQAGVYDVMLVLDAGDSCATQIIRQVEVGLGAVNQVQVSGPTTFCLGGFVDLTAPLGANWLWNTGEVTRSIRVDRRGTYFCLYNSPGASIRRTTPSVYVDVLDVPLVVTQINRPTNGLSNGSINVQVRGGSTLLHTYLWNTGATTASIAGLQAGTYTLVVTDGVCPQNFTFHLIDSSVASSVGIVAAEVFIGVDPGPGLGIPIPVPGLSQISAVADVSLGSIPPGLYFIGVRVKDALSGWGIARHSLIRIEQQQVLPLMPNLIEAEYFVDIDPGPGRANPIQLSGSFDTMLTQTFQASVAQASPGLHRFSVRVRDAEGNWSFASSTLFFVSPPPPPGFGISAPLIAAEYFFDADPGCGNGVPIAVQPGDTIVSLSSVAVSSLSTGFHQLSVRGLDLFGHWSHAKSMPFEVISVGCSPAIPDFSVGSNAQPGSSVLLSSTSQNVDSNTTYGWYVGDVRGSASSNDFEQNTQGWNVTDVFSFQGSNVLGPFINQSISYNQSGLSPHVSKTISFDLYAHDSWDGDEPFTFSVNGQSLGTFYFNPYAVWCCGHTPLTYPQVVYQGQVGGRCWGTPSSVYRVRFTIPDTSSSLSFSIDQSNGEWLCNESWSIDNFSVRLGRPFDFTGPVAQAVFAQAGVYDVMLVLDAGDSCATQIIRQVNVGIAPPGQIVADGPLTFCAPTRRMLTAPAGSNWLWNTGETSRIIYTTASGMYSVRYNDQYGNVRFSTPLILHAPPEIRVAVSVNHESNGGSNGSARVTASGGSAWQYAYLWSNGATGPFVDGLTQGVYYVQVSDGVCSRTEYFQIFDVSAANSTDVVAAEYFFDTDPGPGLGYSLSIGRGVQVGTFSNIPSAGLSIGLHFMGVRTKNVRGDWSHAVFGLIRVIDSAQIPTTPRATLDSAAYFIDTDPGIGLDQSFAIPLGQTAIQGGFSLPTGTLSLGGHTLAVRVRDSNGQWSTVGTAPFTNCVPPAVPVASADVVACEGDTVRFGLQFRPLGNIHWTGPNGFYSQLEQLEIPSANTAMSGMYLVRMESTSGCFSAPDTVWVRVETMPVMTGSIHGSPVVCWTENIVSFSIASVNTASNYAWSIPSGAVLLSGGNTENITLDLSGWTLGVGQISVTASNSCGSVTSIPFSFRRDAAVPAATVSALTPTSICAGSLVTLESSQPPVGLRIRWIRNGSAIPGADQPIYSPTLSGFYQVQILNALNCPSPLSNGIQVNIEPYPQSLVSVTGVTNLCGGQSVMLTGSPVNGGSYQWLRDGVVVPGLVSRVVMVNTAGLYRLVVRNPAGCSDTSQSVQVNNLLGTGGQILISGPSHICPSQSVLLSGTQLPNVMYKWLLDGQVLPGQNSSTLLAISPGTYRMLVSNSAGTCTDTSTGFLLSAAQPVQNHISAQACSGTGFLFGGALYFSSGTYTSTLTSASGCDSVVTLNLTVGRDTSVQMAAAICAPGNYVFGSQVLTSSGRYTQLMSTTLGCDSFITLNLTVHPQQPVTVLNQSICSPGSFVFNGQSYHSSGLYTALLINAQGCDSLVQLNLMVNQPVAVHLTQTICAPSVAQVGGQTFGQSGIYMVHLSGSSGCDSVVNLNLTVNQPGTHSLSATICAPASYNFNGQSLTTTGTYTSTLTNAVGCDSVIALNLTVNQPGTHSLSATICAPASYSFNGFQYANSGLYTALLTNQAGCDSLVTLNLTVLPCNRITGRISYLNRFATPMNQSQVQLLSGNTVLGTTSTDAQGLFLFTGLSSGQPYHFGVSTQKPWGGVNATDAFFVNQHFSGRAPLMGLFHRAADVNLSSVVNATDALQILSRYAVQGYTFALSDWVFSDSSVTLQNDTVAVHLRALTAGDANGSYVPLPGLRHAAGILLQQSGSFDESDGAWPIRVGEDLEVAAISLDLLLPDGLRVRNIRVPSAAEGSSPVVFEQHDRVLRLAWFGSRPLNLRAGDDLLLLETENPHLNTALSAQWLALADCELANGMGIPHTMPKLLVPVLSSSDRTGWSLMCYPNPFGDESRLSIQLSRPGSIYYQISDASGRRVYSSPQELLSAGAHTIYLPVSLLSAGVYQCSFVYDSGGIPERRQLRLVKAAY